jgi:hypothetical protein
MTYRISGLALTVLALFGCSSGQPAMPPQPLPEEVVTVVAEPTYYVSGAAIPDEKEMLWFKERDPKRIWQVDGIVFKIIRPPEYAGQIITMHHDGMLVFGDA